MIKVKKLIELLKHTDEERYVFLARTAWDSPIRELEGIKMCPEGVVLCAGDIVAVPPEKEDEQPDL